MEHGAMKSDPYRFFSQGSVFSDKGCLFRLCVYFGNIIISKATISPRHVSAWHLGKVESAWPGESDFTK